MRLLTHISLAFFLMLCGVSAQPIPYTLQVLQDTYVPLTNSTPAVTGLWDDPTFSVSLPFPVKILNVDYQNLVQGDFYSIFALRNAQLGDSPAFIPYGADLIDRGATQAQSPITYKTQGPAGDRIFIMEWKNAGFFEESVPTSFVNFQIWLFESNDVLEIHFGDNNVTPDPAFGGFTGPFIGFFDVFNPANSNLNDLIYLRGNPLSPAFHRVGGGVAEDTLSYTLNGSPANGTVYRFIPQTVSAGEAFSAPTAFHLFPTAAAHFIHISVDQNPVFENRQLRYQVFSADGTRAVSEGAINAQLQKVDIGDLAPGVYTLAIFADNGIRVSKRFVKI